MGILYEINGSTGGGHEMLPDPEGTPSPTEESVVNAVTNAASTNDNVASLFGIQKWSNVKRIRVLYNGTVGHTGIGTWKDGAVTSADEADWWQNNAFMLLDTSSPTVDGYDTDFNIMVDPSSEPVTLGGFIIDTTTGKMCIRFANYVINPADVKIAVDITFTRTDVG